ncbi:MAG: LuxR family transcriptional regulator, partial [Chloroflexi bacterium]|nr:LuxR family transcriptional regulator [Chloroflexota bacterium]
IHIMATIGLGTIRQLDNQLHQAIETFQRVLQLAGDPPLLVACAPHLGLASVFYEWNDLDAAQYHAQQSAQLARPIDTTDRYVASQVFLARLKLAQGDTASAASILSEAELSARQHNFVLQVPEIAAAQVLTALHQGNLSAAAHLAQTHDIPLSQARVHLALGDPVAALAVLESWRGEIEARGWADERLKAMVLEAVTLHAHGETDMALHVLEEALALAAPGGFIRLFVDEGEPMAHLLAVAAVQGMMPDYVDQLLAACKAQQRRRASHSTLLAGPLLAEPLSQRELEVLQLVAQGLSNHEIGERLYLALSTVKGHNRNIYGKLQVQRRTEAVARARELGLV